MAKKKSEDAPIDEAEAPVEEVPEPTAEEIAVKDAAADLAEAQKNLTDAQATHDAAKSAHAAATAPPPALVGRDFLMEGSMVPVRLPDPQDGPYPRRINKDGVNYEHVSDALGVDGDGKEATVWVYRRM